MTYDVVSPALDATPSQYVTTGIDTMARAIRLTRSFFPGQVRVEVEQDPEIPDDSYLVFHVTAEGPLADVVSRRLQWHEEVRGLIPDAAQRLRLSVDAKATISSGEAVMRKPAKWRVCWTTSAVPA